MEDPIVLEGNASNELLSLMDEFRKQVITLKMLYEKIVIMGREEHFDDLEIWLLLRYTFRKLDIAADQQRKFLAPFKPARGPTEILPENLMTERQQRSSMESFEGNLEIDCYLSAIDEDPDVARSKLHMWVDQIVEKWTIKFVGYKFKNLKPDSRNLWIVPEGLADEALIS